MIEFHIYLLPDPTEHIWIVRCKWQVDWVPSKHKWILYGTLWWHIDTIAKRTWFIRKPICQRLITFSIWLQRSASKGIRKCMDNLGTDEREAKNAKSEGCFFGERFVLRSNYSVSIVIWKRIKLTASALSQSENADMACY